MPRSRISGAIGGRGLTCRRGRQQPCQHPSRRLHTVAVEANIEPVHPHAGHSSDRKRCPGGPHTCEHQRTHAGLSSTRQWPPTACTPSLAAALVGAPQQRLASAKSAASTKLWKRPGLPPGMRQHSPCDHPPTCRQQWSALTSPTAWHTMREPSVDSPCGDAAAPAAGCMRAGGGARSLAGCLLWHAAARD